MESVFNKIFMISLFDLWWVAIWGIAYILVEWFAKGNKKVELLIYFAIIFIILSFVVQNPRLIEHF